MDFILRKATVEDIQLLIRLRMDFLMEEQGPVDQKIQDAMLDQLGPYFQAHLMDGSFVAIIGELDGQVASAAFLTIAQRPAYPPFLTGKVGTLSNVLTYPVYRRKGMGKKVVAKILEEAKQLGVSAVDLFATQDGKALYEALGFQESKHPAMRISL